ncbi:hypothetical protein VEx25_B0263 [Vibrio antiquarius]|uniref:Uncharacterized protein n=1 Tax=Vibrio antiquarius (strain Ex25) TaxID=150340 RepID=A0ABM9WSF3_VIBAE|nr:hypothetical protein VEx25_B0263 [Vibrio antiquarius]
MIWLQTHYQFWTSPLPLHFAQRKIFHMNNKRLSNCRIPLLKK